MRDISIKFDPITFVNTKVNLNENALRYANKFDVQRDGKFSREEFDNLLNSSVNAIASILLKLNHKKISKIFDDLDSSNKNNKKDGYITYKELELYLEKVGLDFNSITKMSLKDAIPKLYYATESCKDTKK